MLSCDLHDYIEIACMYRLPLELELRDGQCVSGTAIDTCRNAEKQECIQLAVTEEEGRQRILVVLDELRTMRALVKNPHFDVVKF